MPEPVGLMVMGGLPGLDPALRTALTQAINLRILGEAELLQAESHCKIALITAQEPHIADALAQIAALKGPNPGLRVVVAFDALSSEHVRRLLNVGVDALVSATAAPDVIWAALKRLADSSGVTGQQLPSPGVATEENGSSLTRREAEVLRFLSAGFSNKEVARRLNVSVRTIETHRLNLRRKTQTGRLRDLVSLARQLGLEPVLDAKGLQERRFEPLMTRVVSQACPAEP